ncbi:MAG: enoyl-CoA hydratase [Acidimicrobiia bacterium]|nr:enoyl-CoA hydratase [Acidimicrobiia bacterium]
MKHIEVERRERVGIIWLDRPDKGNALSADMWGDLPDAAQELAEDRDIGAIVLTGRGGVFTVGIDLAMLVDLPAEGSPAARNQTTYQEIKSLQQSVSVFSDIDVPTIAAVSGWCVGAGVDLITACDMRVSGKNAVYSVRETRMGLVADVGTLQRLPKIVSPGVVADLVYTGRDVRAPEALDLGLVDRLVDDPLAEAIAIGERIAANPPLAVRGAKRVLREGSSMSTDQALEYVALWNAAFLQSNDLTEALQAFEEGRKPDFTGS